MTMAQEKVTVAVACKTLGISQRSLYRLLKEGRLTRIKEGRRTYILTSEVHAMRQELAQPLAQKKTANVTGSVAQSSDVVTVARDRYEGLLQELGELKERDKLFLEYKDKQVHEKQALEQELAETRAKLMDAQEQLKEKEKPFLMRFIDNLKKR